MFKGQVKDTLSRLRQRLGLPHNKTRAQIRAADAIFNGPETDRQRIDVIARVTGQPADTVAAWIEGFEPPVWTAADRQTWYGRGGLMMNPRDLRTLYALVCGLRPAVCVETGAASGASSAAILMALDQQDSGRLISIDLERPHAAHYGALIPERLRARWELRLQPGGAALAGLVDELPGPVQRVWARIGGERPILPAVLDELGEIDFFLHDSRHTFRHMRWEYEQAWPYLRAGGCLASHDVAAASAFDDFCRAHADTIRDGGTVANLGFLIKCG
ncbi:MAG: class I SAM-dependent methyltransferase [Anaerolineae bacterium]|nr:class I SAM-dependent methyltransferase [Anaerolineae bacterium]